MRITIIKVVTVHSSYQITTAYWLTTFLLSLLPWSSSPP